MAKLKPGALTIDLKTQGIYGDLDHCPLDDLLESAEAFLSLLPEVEHKGLRGFSKDFDASCYVHTTKRSYRLPEDIHLETDIYRGGCGFPPSKREQTSTISVAIVRDRDYEWRGSCFIYEPLIGCVRDGKVSTDTEGIVDLHAEALKRREEWEAESRRKQEERDKNIARSAREAEAERTGQLSLPVDF